ncbi:DsbA family protein [Streptomyces lateritius]|nr:DsbA family protein [Streptomyces lateritius]
MPGVRVDAHTVDVRKRAPRRASYFLPSAVPGGSSMGVGDLPGKGMQRTPERRRRPIREVTTTLHVYEDPRCPVVEEYETTGVEGIEKPLLLRQTRARYTFATFKDERLGGDGSKRAVNALRAALEQQKFVEYHRVLFDNQATVEASGGFTTDRLLKLAAQVPGLRGEAFDSAVRTMKYRAFVTASDRAFDRAGENISDWGTPSLLVDGHWLEGSLYGVALDADLLGVMVTDLHRRPSRWESYSPR